jgi:hypothetical protein
VGAHVSVVIDWPLRQQGIHPIELYARGVVLRSAAGNTAVAMYFRELRVLPASQTA